MSIPSHNTAVDISAYPKLPRCRGVFITGTDTAVGKTVIAGAIAMILKDRGIAVDVFKPAATGCVRAPGGLISADGAFLAACADSRRSLPCITPLRFSRALAPNVAASLEGAAVDLDLVFEEYTRMAETAETVVVEGVGGIMCPLSGEFKVIHFAAMTGLPLVIVVPPGLGMINHTLLTIHAARSAGIDVAGIIINRYVGELDVNGRGLHARDDDEIARMTNPKQVSLLGRVPVLCIVMEDADTSVSDVRLGRDVLRAVRGVDWMSIIRQT